MRQLTAVDSEHHHAIVCTSCRGEGVVVQWSGAGYDAGFGGYYPREVLETCRDCEGAGEALCSECGASAIHEDPSVEHTHYCDECAPASVRALLALLNDVDVAEPVLARPR